MEFNICIKQKISKALPMATELEIEEIINFLGNSVFREIAEVYLNELIKNPNKLLREVDTEMLVNSVKKSFKSCLRSILTLDYENFINKK